MWGSFKPNLVSMRLLFAWLLIFFSAFSIAQKYVVIDSITIAGNRITREAIIRRELTMAVGDTIPVQDLAYNIDRTIFNINNTLLFLKVTADTLSSGFANHITLAITVKERWYIFPSPFVYAAERNFNAWLVHRDITRINYGLNIRWKNFTGNRDRLRIILKHGFDQQAALEYTFPYINRKQTLGLITSISYSQNREIAYYTSGNKLLWQRNPDGQIRTEWEALLGLTYRQGLYNMHELDVLYNYARVGDTILKLNPEFFRTGSSQANFFTIRYKLKRDLRDYVIMPLKGYYVEFVFLKQGLGLLNNELQGPMYAGIRYSKYWELTDRLYFQVGTKLRVGARSRPYYTRYGLGYEMDYIRGYEYNVVEGNGFGFVKTNFKIALLKNRTFYIKQIPTEKFNTIPVTLMLCVHSDMGYASSLEQERNPLNNTLLYGNGVGLELLTYYDKLWRVEYSITREGKSGVFLTFFAAF